MARRKQPQELSLFDTDADAAGEDFFEQPHNWSLEKLQILEDFMWPWSMKLGRISPLLAYVDAFAGRGQYRDENGTPGSPLRAVQLAERLQSEGRTQQLRCLFLEKDRATHAQLATLLADRAPATVERGELRTHNEMVQKFVDKDPALVFLDPFGTKGIEFDLVSSLMGRRNSRGDIPTDLLINFSVPGAKRRMGMVHHDEPWAVANFQGLLEVLNDEDYQVASDLLAGISYEGALRNLLDGYLDRLRTQLRAHAFAFPIRRRHQGPVQFHLIIVSRHADAVLLMNQHCHSSAKRIFVGAGHQGRIDFMSECWERERSARAENDLPSFLTSSLPIPRTVAEIMLLVIDRYDLGTFAEKDVLGVVRRLIAGGKLRRVDPSGRRSPSDPRGLTSSSRIMDSSRMAGAAHHQTAAVATQSRQCYSVRRVDPEGPARS